MQIINRTSGEMGPVCHKYKLPYGKSSADIACFQTLSMEKAYSENFILSHALSTILWRCFCEESG